jgi:hypothetical protein
MYYALGLIVVVALMLAYIYYSDKKEHEISEPAYLLMSRGFNLPATDGSYLGGMYLLNAAENADTVSDVRLAY